MDWLEGALEAVRDRTARICVVGCGYVGLTVAVEAARAGLHVLGVEADEGRAKDLAAGSNPVPDVDVPDAELVRLRDAGLLRFATTLAEEADAFVICVPTPLRDGSPDLHFIEEAAESVAPWLSRGNVVVLESTTYPGTTEELLAPALERVSGLVAGEDYALAHSPERIDPGNRTWGMRNTPKVVGGLTPGCTELAAAFYEHICDEVVTVSSPRAAEITKLLENTFREVNIALVNEMATICHSLEIDPWEVVEAASTKPFGFTRFNPGPGVGGHCIGQDPQFLAWRTRGKAGHQFRLVETAHDVNQRMPAFVAQRAAEILNEEGKAMRGASVLLLGVAFKGGSADIRESPALRVAERLTRSGAKIAYHDPFVPAVTIDGIRHESVELSSGFVAWADIVIVLTDHPNVDYPAVVSQARCIYDTRGVTRAIHADGARIYRI